MKTTIEPIVYSQQDAAKALKCNVDAVRDKLMRGEIPAYKDGTYWKIPRLSCKPTSKMRL